MENHLANQHRVLAADYAKESLRREPRSKDAHSELFVHRLSGGGVLFIGQESDLFFQRGHGGPIFPPGTMSPV